MSTLSAIGLRKAFPGVLALEGVDFEIRGGVIHALVGANGAGKSTLIKILSGYYPHYEGRIEINGKPVTITKPSHAFAHGIEVVHQEVDTVMIPYLTVAENLLIERLASGATGTFLRMRRLYAQAEEVAKGLNLDIDVRRRVEDLTLPQKQMLVIARAISRRAPFLILDEPTSSLSLRETEQLFDILNRLKEQGVGIIYVSHRLQEIQAIADEVTVLRNGRRVAHFEREFDLARVVEAMLGVPQGQAFPPRQERQAGEVVLEVRGLSKRGQVHDVSLRLRHGEILGITGLTGSGKTQLLHLLYGAESADDGEILLEGRPVRLSSPGAAVAQGIYLVPEERRRQGLFIDNTVRENISLPFLKLFTAASFVMRGRERAHAQHIIERVRLTPPDPEMLVKNLSGGNQQKVVIGKWLGGAPRVIMFDEATQGIDVGAKQEVYLLAQRLAQRAGVIFATSDIDEALGLADRVLVMRDGRVVAELPIATANRQTLLAYAVGAESSHGQGDEAYD
ncbi:MAG: sugar ABC transporter ATP-binding protein [Chloroflexi bacterium]|nr:MAG: sugar ABC transporter ATP-binding protein [Chloroflexota bacterium]